MKTIEVPDDVPQCQVCPEWAADYWEGACKICGYYL